LQHFHAWTGDRQGTTFIFSLEPILVSNRMRRSLHQRGLRDAAAYRSNQGMGGKKYVGF
jgi:hypothetical protein